MEYDALAAIIPDQRLTPDHSLIERATKTNYPYCDRNWKPQNVNVRNWKLNQNKDANNFTYSLSFQLSKDYYSNFSTMMKHPNCLFCIHPYSLFLNNNANKYKSFETPKKSMYE